MSITLIIFIILVIIFTEILFWSRIRKDIEYFLIAKIISFVLGLFLSMLLFAFFKFIQELHLTTQQIKIIFFTITFIILLFFINYIIHKIIEKREIEELKKDIKKIRRRRK